MATNRVIPMTHSPNYSNKSTTGGEDAPHRGWGARGEGGAPTPLAEARIELGFRSRPIAYLLGLDPSGYARIEAGRYRPRADTADAIYQLYGGLIPLGLIAFPTHPIYRDFLTPHRRRRLRARGRELYAEHRHLQAERARLDPRRGR